MSNVSVIIGCVGVAVTGTITHFIEVGVEDEHAQALRHRNDADSEDEEGTHDELRIDRPAPILRRKCVPGGIRQPGQGSTRSHDQASSRTIARNLPRGCSAPGPAVTNDSICTVMCPIE